MKTIRRYCILSIIVWMMYSLTFCLMPAAEAVKDHNRLFIVMVGIVFWITFLIGIGLYIARGKMEKKMREEEQWKETTRYDRKFFNNIPQSIVNVLFIAGLIVSGVLVVSGRSNEYAMYITIGVLAYSFVMNFWFSDKLCMMAIKNGSN